MTALPLLPGRQEFTPVWSEFRFMVMMEKCLVVLSNTDVNKKICRHYMQPTAYFKHPSPGHLSLFVILSAQWFLVYFGQKAEVTCVMMYSRYTGINGVMLDKRVNQ